MKTRLPNAPSRARLRHGGYAAIVTVLVIAALVLLNLVIGRLPLKLDLSGSKMYSLSDQSAGFLKGLKLDITIYGLFAPGREPPDVVEILKRYRDASARVHLEFLDVEKNPAFAKKYDTTGRGVSPGSIIVVDQKSGRFKVVPYMDLYNVSVNQQTGAQRVMSVAIEQRVTAAIDYAAGAKIQKLYELSGHSEFTLLELGILEDVTKENNEVKAFNLMTGGNLPPDADLVLVISPKTDLMPGETEALKRYIEGGGNAVFLLDLMKSPLPNFESVINLYGVATNRGIVLEGDSERMAPGMPNLLIPALGEHEILASLKEKKFVVTILNSQGLRESGLKRQYLKVTPLITSSTSSLLRSDLSSDSLSRISSDISGIQVLAYAVEAPSDDPKAKAARFVVTGASYFIIDQAMSRYMGPGNKELFLNMVSWAENRQDGMGIRPKSAFQLPLQMNGLQSLIWLGIVIILVPGAILAAGIAVWVRRRHR